MNQKLTLYILCALVCWYVALLPLSAVESSEKVEEKIYRPLPLFQSDQLLEVTLVCDIKKLRSEARKEDRPYRKGKIIYRDPQKGPISLDVLVNSRGQTRRNPRLCDSPPLSIKFDQKQCEGTVFSGQKKLKLVTHCRNKVGVFQKYLLREYHIYKLYNALTEKSFRVRMLRITYKNSPQKARGIKKYGFLIEAPKRMARRNEAKLDKSDTRHWELDDARAQILFSMFQFMIGNTDWSIPVKHNVKIIQSDKEKSFFAVPYDFDLACLVHAYYARPAPKLQDHIQNICTRLYRGYCRPKNELMPVFQLFNDKKAEIYAIYQHSPYLKRKFKKEALTYLDKFYKIINDPVLIKKHFIDSCKKR